MPGTFAFEACTAFSTAAAASTIQGSCSFRRYGLLFRTLLLLFFVILGIKKSNPSSFLHSTEEAARGASGSPTISDSSENELPPGCDFANNRIDKSKTYHTCVIGAGLSGTVFAERTANLLKKKVLVIDSRPHIGGNCYDFIDQKTGILRNQYGSHLFHTKIERVWDYVTSNPKAPRWKPWYHQKFGRINGTLYSEYGMLNGTYYVPIPVNISTVNRLFGLNIQTEDEMNEWLQTVQIPCPPEGCQNAEEMAKSRVGEALYKAIFETYTIKQWDKSPKDLDASVSARIPVRSNADPRYFADKWQALAGKGYTEWFEAMLDHHRIDVVLNTDFFDHKDYLEGPACETIVYTGPIDRYFASLGFEKLQYRSITFTEERYYNHPGYILPTPVLNYPGPETPYTRAIEYKHYLHQDSPHSIVVKETASDDGEPYYPIPNNRNKELYEKYKQKADELEQAGKFVFVGRLANYKYFDMDKAIDNALSLFEKRIDSMGGLEATINGSRLSWSEHFRGTHFHDYRALIDQKIERRRKLRKAEFDTVATTWIKKLKLSCKQPFYRGEFGMEMRAYVPWAYYRSNHGCYYLHTTGSVGSKYMYWFSDAHEVRKGAKRGHVKPYNNPVFPTKEGVHVSSISKDAPWQAPPFREFFRHPDADSFEELQEKPLIVIMNKYQTEWGGPPANFFSQEMLTKMLDYLVPKYTVLYKRHTASKLEDNSEFLDLNEKDHIRQNYPAVVFYEDLQRGLDDPEDQNLLQFSILSLGKHFLAVQGGTAVISSWFGGTTSIFLKEGPHEKLAYDGYFHKFSNSKIVWKNNEEDYIDHVKEIL